MIKRFVESVSNFFAGKQRLRKTPKRIDAAEHKIDKTLVARSALRVCETLQKAGYEAYLVGGAVRDLLLGIAPKDFDVATNATPEQVKTHFRRAIIIGRRFRLVHVMFGAETIEVSTYRALDNPERQTDAHGRVLADNLFGPQHEDAARRDFTINALYYDPTHELVLDYHDGVKDIRRRRVRMIGDPATRYREDPVRMLRLFDEMLKLLMSGHAVACIMRLRAEGLHHGLLPLLDVILEQPAGERFVMLALSRTDERVRAGKHIAPGFLFATLLWHEVLKGWQEREARGEHRIPALDTAIDDVLALQTEKLAIQRRFAADMREIWMLQPRFERRVGRSPFRMLELPRLRAGYDFLMLRCAAEEAEAALGEWWTRFIEGDDAARELLVTQANSTPRSEAPRRKRRRRGGRGARRDDDASDAAPSQPTAAHPQSEH